MAKFDKRDIVILFNKIFAYGLNALVIVGVLAGVGFLLSGLGSFIMENLRMPPGG